MQGQMALPLALQTPVEQIFDRLLADAAATARRGTKGPSEVSWVEGLHLLVALNLERDLRGAIRTAREADSVHVATGFIHGNPFKIEPVFPVQRCVEAGDILLVGERYDQRGSLTQREALLLQMKVGPPKWSSQSSSTAQQALLYGAWPPCGGSAAPSLRSLAYIRENQRLAHAARLNSELSRPTDRLAATRPGHCEDQETLDRRRHSLLSLQP